MNVFILKIKTFLGDAKTAMGWGLMSAVLLGAFSFYISTKNELPAQQKQLDAISKNQEIIVRTLEQYSEKQHYQDIKIEVTKSNIVNMKEDLSDIKESVSGINSRLDEMFYMKGSKSVVNN